MESVHRKKQQVETILAKRRTDQLRNVAYGPVHFERYWVTLIGVCAFLTELVDLGLPFDDGGVGRSGAVRHAHRRSALHEGGKGEAVLQRKNSKAGLMMAVASMFKVEAGEER